MTLRFCQRYVWGNRRERKDREGHLFSEGSADWSRMQRAEGGLYGKREKECCVSDIIWKFILYLSMKCQ